MAVLATLALGGGCSLIVETETCTSSDDCGNGEICTDAGFCHSILGGPCDTLVGSDREDALLLGFIMTRSGAYAESGTGPESALELAVGEINSSGGIQGSQGGRELAFLVCDDGGEVEQALDAARHLTDFVGVPAILGPGFSFLVLEVAKQVTVASGTFLISPSSTSSEVRGMADDDLVWRTSSEDVVQAATLAYYAAWLANDRASADGGSLSQRVVTVHSDDTYGSGFKSQFNTSLLSLADALETTSGEAVSIPTDTVKFPAENDGFASALADVVESVVASEPDVLLLVGFDSVADIVGELAREDALEDVPMLLADGTRTNQLATAFGGADVNHPLIFGVNPGFRAGAPWEHFKSAYNLQAGTTSPPVWTEYAYDAVYLLAYAAASVGPDAVTGRAFADAFTRFDEDGGRRVNVGPAHLVAACKDMGEGKSLQVEGASGPLDFDDATGEPETVGILRWRVDFDALAIEECGLVSTHTDGASRRYWCNALCEPPPDTNDACDESPCEGADEICVADRCTGGDDCMPATAP